MIMHSLTNQAKICYHNLIDAVQARLSSVQLATIFIAQDLNKWLTFIIGLLQVDF